MSRIVRSVLWAAVLFCLVSCAAQKEEVIPTAPEAPPPTVSKPKPELPAPVPEPPKIEIIQLKMTEDQEYVNVKVRIKENELNSLDPSDVYLVDEATGKKYPVVRLQRIGRLASVPGDKGAHHIMFWNNEGGLKVGKLVTIRLGKYQKKSVLLQ